MSDSAPPELARLRAANAGSVQQDDAWESFVQTYSRLLLHTARRSTPDRDAAMDRYAFVLEQLRRDDCRKLRSYVPHRHSKFTTWLVVVAQRICLDHYRQRYGRTPEHSAGSKEDESYRQLRRGLVDLSGTPAELDRLPDPATVDPDARLRETELSTALQASLAGLEPRDRLILKLRFEDDLSASEIAQIVGLRTPFHVYRKLNQLLPLLKDRLTRRGVVEARP